MQNTEQTHEINQNQEFEQTREIYQNQESEQPIELTPMQVALHNLYKEIVTMNDELTIIKTQLKELKKKRKETTFTPKIMLLDRQIKDIKNKKYELEGSISAMLRLLQN